MNRYVFFSSHIIYFILFRVNFILRLTALFIKKLRHYFIIINNLKLKNLKVFI